MGALFFLKRSPSTSLNRVVHTGISLIRTELSTGLRRKKIYKQKMNPPDHKQSHFLPSQLRNVTGLKCLEMGALVGRSSVNIRNEDQDWVEETCVGVDPHTCTLNHCSLSQSAGCQVSPHRASALSTGVCQHAHQDPTLPAHPAQQAWTGTAGSSKCPGTDCLTPRAETLNLPVSVHLKRKKGQGWAQTDQGSQERLPEGS